MHELILWAGFLGAWLLVAGPVYQASLELDEEEAAQNRIRDVMGSIEMPAMPSRWWWLLPPVRIVLGRVRREQIQHRVVEQLTPQEYEQLRDYVNKAMGWIMVGAGGLLIATKETYELVEGLEWEHWVFWLLIPLMALLSFGHAAARSGHDRREDEIRARAES